MADYWNNRPQATKLDSEHSRSTTPSPQEGSNSLLSEYDRHRQLLITQALEVDEQWSAELRRYLKEIPADVTRDTDIVKWWSVRIISIIFQLP